MIDFYWPRLLISQMIRKGLIKSSGQDESIHVFDRSHQKQMHFKNRLRRLAINEQGSTCAEISRLSFNQSVQFEFRKKSTRIKF